MRTHLPGVSPWSHACAEFGAGQRAGGDVVLGGTFLWSDDADGFKTVADELGLLHQVCKSHVKRNTEALIDELRPLVATDSDGSLKAIGVEPAQAVADIVRLGELISSRQPEQGKELEQMHRRYVQAASPKKGA